MALRTAAAAVEADARVEAEHPFPGGYEGLTVRDLSDMARCDCRWCEADRDELDPLLLALWEPAAIEAPI